MNKNLDIFNDLIDYMVTHETDKLIDQSCDCGSGHRTIQYDNCFQLTPMCNSCFIVSHRDTSLYWVEHCNGSFFVHLNISQLEHTITKIMPQNSYLDLFYYHQQQSKT